MEKAKKEEAEQISKEQEEKLEILLSQAEKSSNPSVIPPQTKTNPPSSTFTNAFSKSKSSCPS